MATRPPRPCVYRHGGEQVTQIVQRIEAEVAAYPEGVAYRPGPLL
ncbi:hypothetical protein [Salinispora vitiensis]|nr:hypothetical protein [Salinispora vitiensis]